MGYRAEPVCGLHMVRGSAALISAPCPNHLIRGGLVRADGRDRSAAILVGGWIARSVPYEPRGSTVSHACDPRMHREPGILNRAYAKTVKLNPVISTQERGVEKPRAAPAAIISMVMPPPAGLRRVEFFISRWLSTRPGGWRWLALAVAVTLLIVFRLV